MDPEIEAMATLSSALEALDDQARARILRWASDKFGIGNVAAVKIKNSGDFPTDDEDPQETDESEGNNDSFDSFAEFFAEAAPSNESEKVLVAGYWFQVKEGQSDLTSAQLNKELKNLGHSITNINQKFDTLMAAKPQLAIQLKKSGSAKQARKKYKITQAGIAKTEELLGRNGD